MKKHLSAATENISVSELTIITLDIAALIFIGDSMSNLYLLSIVCLCDLVILIAHGMWLQAGGPKSHGPWRSAAPLLIRLVTMATLFIMTIENDRNAVLSTYAWHVTVVSAVCWAMYSILLTLHQQDDSWLAGTRGRIGIPNWISIVRIAASVLAPHLYAARPYGESSAYLATAILAFGIISDAADGFVARHLGQTTKAGKALDPLGDKVIFYPCAIAFILASNGSLFLESSTPLRLLFYAAFAVMLARDLLFAWWFFHYYSRLKVGIGAGIIDKIRMVAMCAWLSIAACALTFPTGQQRMTIASVVCMVLIALLSICSVVADYKRFRKLERAESVSAN